jgi:signal peptidase I
VDFALILVIAALVTGLIWAVDVFFLAPQRQRRENGEEIAAMDEGAEQKARAVREPVLVEYSRSLFPVIVIVLVLRSFLVEPFRIPSGSMLPTLLVGDFILVNKFAYGIRLPVVNAKIVDIDKPERGDVVVFRYPADPSLDYIKRVVGLPGDTIEYRNKQLFVNGEPVPQRLLGVYANGGHALVERRNESLGGTQHDIFLRSNYPVRNGSWTVPEGKYFVMGDNRDNSNDSRVWGFVPDENLVGKAFLIWMSWDADRWGVEWNRIGDVIH